MRGIGKPVDTYVFLKKIRIQNFKSIKDLELSLRPGINVLIGYNGAGKTNILEAIYFLYKAFVKYKDSIPYMPFLPRYSDPLDIIYYKDPSNLLRYELSMEIIFKAGKKKYYCHKLDWSVVFRAVNHTLIPFIYNINIDDSTMITIKSNLIQITISRDVFDTIILKSEKIRTPTGFIEFIDADKLIKSYKCTETKCVSTIEITDEQIMAPDAPLFLSKILPFAFTRTISRTEDSLLYLVELPLPSLHRNVLYVVKIRKVDEKYVDKLHKKFPKVLQRSYRETRSFLRPPYITVPAIDYLIREIFESIVFLRHPDIESLRRPKPINTEARLDERATNLASILSLFILKRGSWPDRIIYGLRKIFPGLTFRIEQVRGLISLSAEEDGLQLSPAGVPDGAIKLLALLTAIEHNPSILLIDEIENSMHVKMIEHIVDELNSLELPVIVATHSPIVVDLVDPEKILIVVKDRMKGTYIETIKEPEKLRRRLKELGLALSDYLFYEKTYI